jgi:uncharacterized protein (TIGR02391 family)
VISYDSAVTILRTDADGQPQTHEESARIGNKMTFPITADVEDGDLVQYALPNGKTRTVRLANVRHHQAPRAIGAPRDLNHISAEFTPATQPQPVAPPTFNLPGLHARISEVSGNLFRDGHHRQAVREAFQAVEHRVQKLTGRQDTGTALMSSVFGTDSPALDITRANGRNAMDEREGFKLLFMGSMLGLKNPRGHGSALVDTADEAMEALAFASLLMRRLDLAEGRVQ